VKIIRTPEEELIEVAYEEYKLLRSIQHENIVQMYDAFYNQMKSTIYLVMDYVQGQSLKYVFEDKNYHSNTCLNINQIKNIFM
jgi:serine/threonine protein kinase